MSGIVGGDPDRVGAGWAVLAETGDFVTGEEAETRELGAEKSRWRLATTSYINI